VDPAYQRYTVQAAEASALVGNYCDHAEHLEVVDVAWVAEAGEILLLLAQDIAQHESMDLFDLYGRRLWQIEERNALHHEGYAPHQAEYAHPGCEPLLAALLFPHCRTWRDLQLLQIDHDRFYHPDVFGLAKIDQLRHYSFHLAKLAGFLARCSYDEPLRKDELAKRLPDLLLFGIKLHTVIGRRLSDSPFRS
jgi:hypothetical protein